MWKKKEKCLDHELCYSDKISANKNIKHTRRYGPIKDKKHKSKQIKKQNSAVKSYKQFSPRWKVQPRIPSPSLSGISALDSAAAHS